MKHRMILPASVLVLQAACGGTAASSAPTPGPVPESVAESRVEAAPSDALSDERVLELGRTYTALVHASEHEQLWQHMSAEARERIGSFEEFQASHERVMGRLGAEMSVVSETVEPAGAGMIASRLYLRVSHYTGLPGRPVRLLIGFKDDGTIGGMQVRPAD